MRFPVPVFSALMAAAFAVDASATAYFKVDTGADLQFGSAKQCTLRAALLNIAHQSIVGTLGFANPDCPAGQKKNVIEFTFPAGKSGYPEIRLDPALGRLKHQGHDVLMTGVTIDGDRASGLLLVDGKHARLTMRNAILMNGLAIVPPDTAGGCLLYSGGAGVSLVNVRLTDCSSAEFGGAIAIAAPGDLYLERTYIARNASVFGGGVFYFGGGRAFIVDSTIENNVAGHGAGILAGDSTVHLEGSSVRDNSAEFSGGGVHAGALEARMSEFRGNAARGSGGAIFATKSLQVEDATFSGNRSGTGGGAIAAGGELRVSRSGFDTNLTGGPGGAIRLQEGAAGQCVSVSNTTFAHNDAAGGGALWIPAGSAGPACGTGFQLVNNTFFKNGSASQIELAGDEVGDILFANNVVVSWSSPPTGFANCAGRIERLQVNPDGQDANTQFPGASCDTPFAKIPVADLGLDGVSGLTGGVFEQIHVPEAAIPFPGGHAATCFAQPVAGIDQFGNTRQCKQGAVEAAPTFEVPRDYPPAG